MQWTRQEDAQLYALAGEVTIAEAAVQLERTRKGVARRLERLRLRWRQGRYGIRDVAREAGCGVTAARRCVAILFWDDDGLRRGQGGGLRYHLDYGQLVRAAEVLRRTQTPEVRRIHRAAAGRSGLGKPKRRRT